VLAGCHGGERGGGGGNKKKKGGGGGGECHTMGGKRGVDVVYTEQGEPGKSCGYIGSGGRSEGPPTLSKIRIHHRKHQCAARKIRPLTKDNERGKTSRLPKDEEKILGDSGGKCFCRGRGRRLLSIIEEEKRENSKGLGEKCFRKRWHFGRLPKDCIQLPH